MNKERLGRTIAYGTLIVLGMAAVTEGAGACSHGPQTCLSDPKISHAYPGDKTPGVTDMDQGTWRLGILATTANVPRDSSYIGLVVGYTKNPTDLQPTWHDSNPVGKESDMDQKIQLSIGAGDVGFRVRIEAMANSPDCQRAPDTSFSEPQPLDELSATRPVWSKGA